jgi:hypothetical protein
LLLGKPVENVDEFVHLLLTFDVAFGQCVSDARIHVMFENCQADAIQRGFGGGELLQYLDTRPWFLDHFPDSADLAFHTVQARQKRLLFGGSQRGVSFVPKLTIFVCYGHSKGCHPQWQYDLLRFVLHEKMTILT